ncbi:ABC transporter substrate-binding protein [Streptomyces sp. NPDC053367]|uniref:ABC transporter substrate-binding protein n=1 Tax=Streptomyces sp. NPDC053367 TaxID=3365700 RepID=UPI0037D60334
MTGRRHDRSTFLPPLTRPVRAGIRTAGVLVACASLAVGCGLIPGVSGGDEDGPITVMTWAPQDTNSTNKPGMPAFARAYARWVNSHGGINGRKLHVATCNERNDSVSAARCARRAVKENAVAVVGSYSQHANSFFPILEGAGIPFIGGYGITDDEFTSPLSYPVNGGQPALLAALGQELADDCGPVSLVRPDTIAGDQLPVMLNAGLKARGHTVADDVPAAEEATEFSAQTRSALGGATGEADRTGCVVPALGDRTGTFMDSFRRARAEYPEVRTGTVLGSVDQTVIDASGGRSGPYEGSFITGWYPVETDPRWDGMKKVIREQAFTDTRIDPADAGVQTTWIAYTVLKAALDKIGGGEVSADTVRRTLDDGLEIDTGGLTPALRWKFQDRLASIGFPRLVNTDVTLQVVREGRLVAAREGFIDMTKTLQGADV